MGAVVARHEVEEVHGCGGQHGGKRRAPGAGDRPRGQPADDVGVVGVRRRQVAAADVAVERVHAVDDGGVGLQGHAETQPVQENGSHEGPLLGRRGLALDDARERDRRQRRERRRRGAGGELAPDLLELPVHRADHVRRVCRQLQGIGLGEEESLRAGAGDRQLGEQGAVAGGREKVVARADARCRQPVGNLLDAPALGDGDGGDPPPAVVERAQQRGEAHARVEPVVARVQSAVDAGDPGRQDKGPRAGDHARVGQGARDLPQVAAGGDAHRRRAGTGPRGSDQEQVRQREGEREPAPQHGEQRRCDDAAARQGAGRVVSHRTHGPGCPGDSAG